MVGMRLLVCLAVFVPGVLGFAAWMMKDFCDRELVEGEIIMNEAAILTNDRFVRVFRDDKELASHSSVYVPGEILTVQLSDSTGQFVLEGQHAEFVGGGCKKKNRMNKNHAALKMPTSGTLNVTIKAGWSMGHQQVQLTPTFVLAAPKKKKSSKKQHPHHPDHRKATTLAGLSKKVGLFSSKEEEEAEAKGHHGTSGHDNGATIKHHGATDHDKELHKRKKSKGSKKGHTHTDIHTDFETKEEAEAERKKGKGKRKDSKAHWRRAAKIIENKLRGTPVETESEANILMVMACVFGVALVFVVYSVVRSNRSRIVKLLSKDTRGE
jgi:hypothetical protein